MKDMRQRTTQFAVRVLKLADSLKSKRSALMIAGQIMRSGTSVGAQYAEAFRAKSRADFIHRIVGSAQELEETIYWLNVLAEGLYIERKLLEPLMKEADELMAILVTMAKNTKSNRLPD